MLMVHEPVKDTIDEKPEKKPRYEMRPRKPSSPLISIGLLLRKSMNLKMGAE
jgi:hypothetical protein